MKPIIRWGLWDRRWAVVGWSVGIALYTAVNIKVYSRISGQATALNKVLDSLPQITDRLSELEVVLSDTAATVYDFGDQPQQSPTEPRRRRRHDRAASFEAYFEIEVIGI
jgi:hypothetical protein